MTTIEQERATLATQCSDAPVHGLPCSIDLGRTGRGLDLIVAWADDRHGNPPRQCRQAIEAPTASDLEFEFERFSLELAGDGQVGLDAANELARLFYRLMLDVSERIRLANQSTRRKGDAAWFEVGVFRWGARDFEFACRRVSESGEASAFPRNFDRVFSGETLDDAYARVHAFWATLDRVSDEAGRVELGRFLQACERAMADARRHAAAG